MERTSLLEAFFSLIRYRNRSLRHISQHRHYSYHTDNHHHAHLQVVDAVRSQSIGANRLSNCFVIDALRSSYSDFSLTVTPTWTGLLDLAKTKSLNAEIDTSIPHYLSRQKNRDVNHITSVQDLKDDVQFGRYDCCWRGCNFYMYEADFPETEYTDVSNHYILYPREHAREINGRSAEVDELLVAAFSHGSKVDKEIWLFDEGRWQRSEKLWQNVENASWDDVILNDGLSQEIRDNITTFFDRKDFYKSFGIPWKRGVILHGLPGNGKTISIKAIMRSLSLRPIPIPTLYVKSLGNECTHQNIRSIFEKARETAPCLLVFEDLDSLVTGNVRSFFLNEVDGLEQNDGILMLGSTNHLDRLDVGISKRPSRFDRKFHFPLPTTAERVRYCEHWRAKLTKNTLIDFPEGLSQKIAEASEGLSFAYLQEVFVASMFSVMENTRAPNSVPSSAAKSVFRFIISTGLGRSNIVWQTISEEIAKVRKELEDSKKSIADGGQNSVFQNTASGGFRRTGFAR